MTTITPYRISVPDTALERLQQKLALTTLPDELSDAGWAYGAPLADIKSLLHHWQTSYSWRAAEAALNKLPQFTAPIAANGFAPLQIHFVHKKSARPNAIPLLFVHGWPGSFIEVTKMIDALTDPTDGAPAFDVVAPSLPNYGFSEGPKEKGFAIPQYAQTCHRLMQTLGYAEYATQGGDWGYVITRCIGLQYPSACKASLYNMAVPKPPTFRAQPLLALRHALTAYTEREKAGLQRAQWFRSKGFGYNLQQSTKPQTVGYSQADSPVGLLAWIYEKLHDWTDDYPWTPDETLTWISVYLFSTAGPWAPSRHYYESHQRPQFATSQYTPGVKLGFSYFPKEILPMPRVWHATLGEVVYEKTHERGGHFAAWECPEALVADLRAMFGKGGGAEGCVKGRSGLEGERARL